MRVEKWVALGLAGGALIVTAIVALHPARENPPASQSGAGWPGIEPPADPGRPASVSPASSLTPPVGTVDVPDIDRLIASFRTVRDNPTATAAAKDFLSDPELKERYDDFAEDQESPHPKDSLAKLADDLADSGAFRRLVSRFSQEPGFRDIAAAVGTLPEGRTLIARLSGAAHADAPSAARSSMFGFAGGAGAAPTNIHLAPTQYAADGPSGLSTNGEGVFTAASSQTSTATDAVAANAADGAVDTGKADGYDVPAQLAGSGASSSDPMQTFCQVFPGFCANGQVKPEFRALIPYVQSGQGVWGGCFATNVYQDCRAACAASPGCVPETAWQACLELNGRTAFSPCVQQCLQKGVCQKDAGYLTYWNQYCSGASPASWCAASGGNCGGQAQPVIAMRCLNGLPSTVKCVCTGSSCSWQASCPTTGPRPGVPSLP